MAFVVAGGQLGVRGEDAWRVRRVWIKGNRRTRPDVVAACVKPVLKARTFDQVLARVAEAAGELKGLGIFKSVNLVLDDLPDDLANADPSACDLRVELVEHKLTRIEVKTSTTVGENEPDVVRIPILESYLPVYSPHASAP
jgi:outer membrane protein assembly factor BamA